jgi:hypothetical protein
VYNLVENYKINGTVARRVIRELLKVGHIRTVAVSFDNGIYPRSREVKEEAVESSGYAELLSGGVAKGRRESCRFGVCFHEKLSPTTNGLIYLCDFYAVERPILDAVRDAVRSADQPSCVRRNCVACQLFPASEGLTDEIYLRSADAHVAVSRCPWERFEQV